MSKQQRASSSLTKPEEASPSGYLFWSPVEGVKIAFEYSATNGSVERSVKYTERVFGHGSSRLPPVPVSSAEALEGLQALEAFMAVLARIRRAARKSLSGSSATPSQSGSSGLGSEPELPFDISPSTN